MVEPKHFKVVLNRLAPNPSLNMHTAAWTTPGCAVDSQSRDNGQRAKCEGFMT